MPVPIERSDGSRSSVPAPTGREHQRQFSGIAEGLARPPEYAHKSTARANAPAGVFSTSL